MNYIYISEINHVCEEHAFEQILCLIGALLKFFHTFLHVCVLPAIRKVFFFLWFTRCNLACNNNWIKLSHFSFQIPLAKIACNYLRNIKGTNHQVSISDTHMINKITSSKMKPLYLSFNWRQTIFLV